MKHAFLGAAFAAVLDALTTLPQPHMDWGLETAAQLVDEIGSPGGAAKVGVYPFDHPIIAALPPQGE